MRSVYWGGGGAVTLSSSEDCVRALAWVRPLEAVVVERRKGAVEALHRAAAALTFTTATVSALTRE